MFEGGLVLEHLSVSDRWDMLDQILRAPSRTHRIFLAITIAVLLVVMTALVWFDIIDSHTSTVLTVTLVILIGILFGLAGARRFNIH